MKENYWLSLYRKKIKSLGYKEDNSQTKILSLFGDIENALNNKSYKEHNINIKYNSGFLDKFFARKKDTNIELGFMGLYLYGGVGRGKTFLMDIFCENTSYRVMRLHFYRFMEFIHSEISKNKNKKNPLKIVAENIADRFDVICIDEFFVNNITDAMILYTILDSLFLNNVMLITTSNIIPSELYKDGLQRSRFLPAIDLINDRLKVVEIDSGKDFRKNYLKGRGTIFFDSNKSDIEKELEDIFIGLSKNKEIKNNDDIDINSRKILYIKKADEVIWFSFRSLCETYRSVSDYIVISSTFSYVILSDIPILNQDNEDSFKRFLSLVDEFYDKGVVLVLSSEIPIFEIYKGDKMSFEFERLKSRLFEMGSEEYYLSNRIVNVS